MCERFAARCWDGRRRGTQKALLPSDAFEGFVADAVASGEDVVVVVISRCFCVRGRGTVVIVAGGHEVGLLVRVVVGGGAVDVWHNHQQPGSTEKVVRKKVVVLARHDSGERTGGKGVGCISDRKGSSRIANPWVIVNDAEK